MIGPAKSLLRSVWTRLSGQARPSGSSPGRSRALALITLAASAGFYTRSILGPLQESIRASFALSDSAIAMLQGPALAIPIMLAAIPLGMLIDCGGRARILLVAALLNIAGTLLTATTDSFVLLLVARSIVGVAASAAWLTSVSLIADLYAPDERGRANSLLAVGQVLAASLAFALGGHLLAASEGAEGWRTALLWLSLPLLPIVLLLATLREPARGTTAERGNGGGAFSRIWRYRRQILPLFAGMAMVDIAVGAVVIWALPNLIRHYGLGAEDAGSAMALVMLAGGIAGPFAGGIIFDRAQRAGGPRRAMAALTLVALLTVPASLFPVMPVAIASIGVLAAFKIFNMAISVASTALATVIVPDDLRGLCIAMLSAIAMLFSLGIAPLVVSSITIALGGPAMLGPSLAIVTVVTGLAGALIFAVSISAYARQATA